MSLGEFLDEAAARNPSKVFVEISGQNITYRDFHQRALQTAKLFQSLGVGHGDRVCLFLPNCPEFLYCWFGLSILGAIGVPINMAGPVAMLRRGRYKLIYSLGDVPQLYDVQTDPNEFHDLAGDAAYQSILADLQAQLLSHWDPVDLEQRVRRSQKERLLIEAATDGAWRGSKVS
jgi:acyl-CoA synthetase (AMP-forming)/AMP-acid ligase II